MRITEVEAYLGPGEDPGSHAHRGITPRSASMFGPPGTLYAYLSYGMHVCANVVCSPAGTASAVLLRAGEVVAGVELARHRRPSCAADRDLARGPGRLAAALGIRLDDDRAALAVPDAAIRLEAPRGTRRPDIASGPRTGVAGPAGGPAYPWRFWVPGDPTVSPFRAHRPRGAAAGPVG